MPPRKPIEGEEQQLAPAFMAVAESMARAAWTFVRHGADLHAAVFKRIRDIADGALGKLKEPND
jgi:hypothetical protein